MRPFKRFRSRHHRHELACRRRDRDIGSFRRLRKRLFLQIYAVVVGSVIVVSILVATTAFHLQAQHPDKHVPIFPFLVLSALIVSLGAYPISKRLTRRLEQLKQGVEALGEGKLDTRLPVRGCDEVAILTTSFNHSAERIQALLASQRQLLANASHELRSPLARMQMGLAMLAEQYELEETHSVQALRHDMAELNQLVEEILLASRLNTLEIPLTTQLVDLAALLAEECARLGLDCEAEAVQTEGDARLLRRLIRNLLENAKRHGGEPIEAHLVAQTPQSLLLTISDRGKGIPAEALEQVFEPFYRPAGHGEGQGGWGLGLSLVRQIATRHGGEVACLNREGGGTVFRVSLPRLV
ncbi:sensor histidine kinase [Thiofilum flexile]|uniref:sensor histidine kinase n=1 Tax=Thiofilum flexile TaxID=125627 RepID=UPI000A0465A7|nr:ATP-binding protein [Thiofilum flexile]